MFKLLNRLAWFISLAMWYIISFSIIWLNSYKIWNDDIIWSIVFWIIAWLIFKKIFLSKDFIEGRLDFFAKSIWENYFWKTIKKPNPWIPSTYQEKEATKIKEHIVNKVASAPWIVSSKTKKVIKKPSKSSIAIKKFFSENLLAKIGWILVFLWVLFLLSLVYSAIWPIWKLLIWFTIWFSIFITWIWLDKKDLKNESRILFGIWILINYLVILSWRYIIWDNIDNNILTTWTTFLFLIFNTVFAVVTSLVYKSRTLLLFSFIFAFINPLLVWWSSDNPYTLIWYSLIVAFGWLFLSFKNKDILLAIWVFILANVLFLIAPFNSDIHWIVKLVSSTIISIITIFTVYNIDTKKLSSIFIWSYIFLILLLWSWDNYIKETTSFITYMISILIYFGIWIYYFLKTSFNSLIYLLISPILIILWLSFTWDLISITLALAVITLIYLIWFNFIQNKLPNFLKYIFFTVLWIYIFMTNSFINFENITLELPSFITVLIVSFIFIFTSYYLSTKKDLEFLYSIWTIWWILILAPTIVNKINIIMNSSDTWISENETQFYLSIIWISIFAISNWILPFINKNLINSKKISNIKNLIIWTITGLLFLWFELFNYWNTYFPWITLGFAFVLLAIIYFVLAYFMIDKIWIKQVKKIESYKNIIYSYLAISISVFSLAIALIFSNYEAVISAIWLFEATIMFYFFYKTKEIKIYIVWILLLMVWIIELFTLIDIVKSKDFIFLIPFSLIAISLVLNLKFLNFIKETGKRYFHDILHILWIGILWILLLKIIPSTWHGWSILWVTIFISISSIVYSYCSSKILKIFLITLFTLFLILQTWEFDSIIWKLERDDLNYLIILQYISTTLLWASLIAWNKINKQEKLNIFINIIYSIYLLNITSLYVYDIFNTTFAVTIYWWITSSIILLYGISKDIIKLRTIWLYLVWLTTLKIFLYDVWFGIDDAVSRVVALIVIWILLIIISTRYTKKYWNNIWSELNFKNLKENK